MDIPWWYFIIATVIGIVIRVWKKPSLGLFAAYSFILLAATVLIRQPFEGTHFQPAPLWSWGEWRVQRNQILTNVVMFIPVGVLGGKLWKWKGLWIALGLSTTIEILQLITATGLCEFDDVIHNCVGAAVGVVFVMITK